VVRFKVNKGECKGECERGKCKRAMVVVRASLRLMVSAKARARVSSL
jgi:hypothetical protein